MATSTSVPPLAPFSLQPRPVVVALPSPFSVSHSHSFPCVLETCCKPTDEAEADAHSHTHVHSEAFSANMGQILSWIRGPRDTPALQDVAVEEQVCANVLCVCGCASLCDGMFCCAVHLILIHVRFVWLIYVSLQI